MIIDGMMLNGFIGLIELTFLLLQQVKFKSTQAQQGLPSVLFQHHYQSKV